MIGLDGVRTSVHAELIATLTAEGLPAEAIHAYPPDELAVPACWIVSPFGMRSSDPRTIVAEVSVLIVVDGAEPAQLAALDRLQAAAWVASSMPGPRCSPSRPYAAGGPTLHAVTITADVDVDVRTLCPPVLEAAAGGRI